MTPPTRREAAREARRDFENVVDLPWSRRASLWLDALTVAIEDDDDDDYDGRCFACWVATGPHDCRLGVRE